MAVIFKYELDLAVDRVPMPRGAEILHVGPHQSGNPSLVHLWAKVDPDNAFVDRVFRSYGTGHVIRDDGGVYVGTVVYQVPSPLVWHVFDLGDDVVDAEIIDDRSEEDRALDWIAYRPVNTDRAVRRALSVDREITVGAIVDEWGVLGTILEVLRLTVDNEAARIVVLRSAMDAVGREDEEPREESPHPAHDGGPA